MSCLRPGRAPYIRLRHRRRKLLLRLLPRTPLVSSVAGQSLTVAGRVAQLTDRVVSRPVPRAVPVAIRGRVLPASSPEARVPSTRHVPALLVLAQVVPEAQAPVPASELVLVLALRVPAALVPALEDHRLLVKRHVLRGPQVRHAAVAASNTRRLKKAR